MKKHYTILFFILFCASLLAQKNPQKTTPSQDIAVSEISGFKLYPNPASNDMVYITTKDNATKDIVIYNIFGEVALKQRILNKQLDISMLVSGIYLMRVTENNKTITRKLVVK